MYVYVIIYVDITYSIICYHIFFGVFVIMNNMCWGVMIMKLLVWQHCKYKKNIHNMLLKDTIHNMKITKTHPQLAHQR